MVRKVVINDIVGGFEKEMIENLLPKLEGSFRQRKQYFEYYFDGIEIELSLEDLENISDHFLVKLSYDELEIII